MEKMRRVRCGQVFQAALGFLTLVSLAACGNAGDGNASLLALFVSSAQTIDAGQSTLVTASIVNDSTPGGASFKVSGGGTLGTPSKSQVGVTEKITALYTAPATVASTTIATVTATSVAEPSLSFPILITVNPALTITTFSIPNGTQSVAYTTTLAATGGTGTETWSLVSGILPAGLTLSPSTGTIAGTPTTAGTSTFTVGLTDSSAVPSTAVATYNITINPPVPVVTTTSLGNGVTGAAYSQQLTYTGGGIGTPAWAITAGSLPVASGLTLSSTGLISGTPVLAGAVYSFSVAVTVGTQTSAAVALTLSVFGPLVITTTSLPNGHVNVAYSQQLKLTGGTGGTATWTISSGSLPTSSGLTLSTAGLIAGTPTTAATYTFSVTVSVGLQTSAPQALSLSITSTIVTSGTTATGEVSLPFSYPLTALGGTAPYTWSLATSSNPLPAGLTLSATTGLISGTPTTTTGSPFSGIIVQAADVHLATGTQTMTITIDPARTSVNNSELSGQYAFLLSGFDAAGNPLASAGKFTADGNGNITSGVIDANDTSLATPVSNTALTATTYAIGSDKRGKITLTTASGTSTFVIALNTITAGIANAGTITEFGSTGQSQTGLLALQTPAAFTTASITGGFAFGIYGFSANSTATALKHSATIGEMQLSSGAVSSAEYLASSTGSAVPVAPASGTLSIASNGRGTLSLVLPGSGGTLDFAVYVVSATKLFLLSSDPASGSTSATRDLLSGQALSQTTTSGNFNTVSLDGVAVTRTEKLDTSATGTFYPDAQIGLITFDGVGNISSTTDENAGGTISSNTLYGTYTVFANGRTTAYLYPAGDGGCLDCAKIPTYFYLVGTDRGFAMDFTSSVTSGYFQPQMGSSFTSASFSGSYTIGTIEPVAQSAVYQSGYLTSTSAGSVTGVEDQNLAGTLTPDAAVSTTYTTATNGRIAFSPSTASSPILYIVSPTEALFLDLSSTVPVIQDLIHE